MNILFTPSSIGTLKLPNRLIRSATAQHLADENGHPRPQLAEMYGRLAAGGVGLIITGYMHVHPSGKCHPEMTGILNDELIPKLSQLAAAVQINHNGMQCDRAIVENALAPLPRQGLSPGARPGEWARRKSTRKGYRVNEFKRPV